MLPFLLVTILVMINLAQKSPQFRQLRLIYGWKHGAPLEVIRK